MTALFFSLLLSLPQPARAARPIKGFSRTTVSESQDWKGWLVKQFPDAQAAWPKDAKSSAPKGRQGETWTFAGSGDYNRDGAPTELLIGVGPDAGGPLDATRLIFAKWVNGVWKTLVEVDHGRLTVNGQSPEEAEGAEVGGYSLQFSAATDAQHDSKDFPGLVIGLSLLDKKGQAMTADSCLLKYSPKGGAMSYTCG